jgi:hypothetical protein
MTPRRKRWLKRFALYAFVSVAFSSVPSLDIAVTFWLLGRWGLPQKLVFSLLRLRVKRRVPRVGRGSVVIRAEKPVEA